VDRGWQHVVVADSESVYQGLRRQILAINPVDVGIRPSPELPDVWGVMMETGHDRGTSTLVGLADGTTSLYLSSGGGIIGGGQHAQVAAATRALLVAAQRRLPELPESDGDALPATDRVAIRALTCAGRRSVEADEDDLGYGRHPLSELFLAAHAVITELRLIEESARR
jgi:hypothetical protein